MWREEKGYTLIEILIVLFISGLVLSGVYSYFSFGTLSYGSGVDKTELQQSLRLTSERITRELRFADWVKLKEEEPDNPGEDLDEGDYCIYYCDDDHKIKIYQGEDGDDYHEYSISRPLVNEFKIEMDGATLKYEIESESGDASYRLESSVFLQNVDSGEVSVEGEPDNLDAIIFTLPEDF